ncbi:hypothetical protein BDV98DRAFT_592221 [Pterulicium gracile]|uniref:Uncharacterized protein n=1 Tax=Pterulicium gracile TaxID=1884261 RepID=A0A5C3QMH4_9AGAR|nr:hypothetical protein BDV98DRAFT_592221 [Pterula gracilis]
MRSYILLSTLAAANILVSALPLDSGNAVSNFAVRKEGGNIDLDGNTGYPEDAEMPNLHGNTGFPKDGKPELKGNTGRPDEGKPFQRKGATENLARRAAPNPAGKALKENKLPSDARTGTDGLRANNGDTARKGSYDARKGGGSTPEVDKALKQNNLDKTTDKGFDTGDKKVGGDEKIKARSPESHVDHYLAKPTAEAFTKREDSTDVDDYLRKYNLPKTTDEAFGRGDDRRSIKGDPVASDDSTLPETAREGTSNGGTYSPPGLKSVLKQNSLPATTEDAFDKRDPSGAGGLPIIGGALARLKGTGLSKRDDLESSELAKRQLGNLKSIPFLGSVIGGGLSMGSKRDTSKRMFLASTKLPINEGAIPIVGGYFSGEPVL